MIDGETTLKKQAFPIPSVVIPPNLVVNVPVNPLPGCCSDYVINVLADNTGLALQNDVGGPDMLMWVDALASAGIMFVQQWQGSWVTIAATSGSPAALSTCGTPYAFGFFTNKSGQNFIGIQMKWASVLANYGTGSYRVGFTFTVPILGNTTIYTNEYCLRTYSASNADGTIRLEYWMNGVTGDPEDDTAVRDYGNINWYSSLRVPGAFGFPKSATKREYVPLNDGESLWTEMEKTSTYMMWIRLVLPFIHSFIDNDVLMADKMCVTDYNSLNNQNWVQKYVTPTSGYDPSWYALQANAASVELTFTKYQNRDRKLRT